MAKAWGGRFEGSTDRRLELFSESISFDWRLFEDDIRQSRAHATMLAEVGLLTEDECQAILGGLATIGQEIAAGTFPFDPAKEDIHLHIESALIERIGDAGRKLHAARSRNDQVATDLRLWVRRHLDLLDRGLFSVQKALLHAANRHKDWIVPGYTHLQRAQPVLAGHYFLAYVEKYQRDRERARDCRRRVNVLPLGAAALAGTTLPIDRRRVAELLDFETIAANSLDAVSDRDFVLETAFVLAMVAGHLSGWAEEWVLWSTTEFDFLRLPDRFCTGSSIMPQKKNPDACELIRAKSARVIGDLQTLLVLVKGLPLAYNRDLQEDKPPLFDAMDTVLVSLDLAAAIIESAELNRLAIERRLEHGFLDATTLMERLIEAGLPMRSAHEAVGKLVKLAVERGATLAELPAAEFEKLLPARGEELRQALGCRNAIDRFVSEGSTGMARVEEQLRAWADRLALE